MSFKLNIKSKKSLLKFLKILGMFFLISLISFLIFKNEKLLNSYKIKYLIIFVLTPAIGVILSIRKNRF